MATAFVDRARGRLGLAVAVAALLAGCSTSTASTPGGPIAVPMQILNTMTLVTVQVNDSSYHALFLLDTGANLTVLTPLYAGRLGIVVPENARRRTIRAVGGAPHSIPIVKVARLAVGEAVVESMDVGVYEAFPQSRSIDGILGADFLNRFNLTFDRTHNRLLLHPVGR